MNATRLPTILALHQTDGPGCTIVHPMISSSESKTRATPMMCQIPSVASTLGMDRVFEPLTNRIYFKIYDDKSLFSSIRFCPLRPHADLEPKITIKRQQVGDDPRLLYLVIRVIGLRRDIRRTGGCHNLLAPRYQSKIISYRNRSDDSS